MRTGFNGTVTALRFATSVTSSVHDRLQLGEPPSCADIKLYVRI